MDTTTMTIDEAVAATGITARALRKWLRVGAPFGQYVKERGDKVGTYIIIRARFNSYFMTKNTSVDETEVQGDE